MENVTPVSGHSDMAFSVPVFSIPGHGRFRRTVSSLRLALLALVVCFASLAPEAAARAEVIGVVENMQGSVTLERAGGSITAGSGQAVEDSDTIRTGPDGAVGLLFTDGSQVALGPDTVFRIRDYDYDKVRDVGRFRGRLERGSLSASSGRIAKKGRDRMLVETPSTILGVRGTRFMVRVDE